MGAPTDSRQRRAGRAAAARRRLLAGATVLLGACSMSGGALAQAGYPNRPVTLVVPYPAGGSADVLARALGQKLAERWGQSVVIDNRAGAATAIGAKAVARAAADGYTLLLGTVSSQAINPAMNKVGYDPVADFTAIAPVASIPFVLVVHPAVAVNSVAELVALAKSKPGELTYASAGIGTSNHLAGELFAADSRITLLHVPYKGSAPALADVLAGHVALMFDLQATSLPHVQAGRLKALAVTGRTRSELLPNVPTMVESGMPGYDVSAWFGLFAPAGVPKPIVERLAAETAAILKSAEMRKHFKELGVEPEYGSADEFSAFVKGEVVKWATTVRGAGLAP